MFMVVCFVYITYGWFVTCVFFSHMVLVIPSVEVTLCWLWNRPSTGWHPCSALLILRDLLCGVDKLLNLSETLSSIIKEDT